MYVRMPISFIMLQIEPFFVTSENVCFIRIYYFCNRN